MASFPIRTQKKCDRRKPLCRASVCRRLCITSAVALILAGCNSSEAPTGELNSSALDLGIPEKIRRVSAVNLDAVTAIANVNNVDYPLTRNGDRFQTTITLEPVASVAVNLRFSETLESGYVLSLARHSQRTQSVDSNNITMQFFEADFDTNFDDDGDSVTNLQERELGTDPTNSNNITRNLRVNFAVPDIVPDTLVVQPRVSFSDTPRAPQRLSPLSSEFTVAGSIGTLNNVRVEIFLTQQISFTPGRVTLGTWETNLPAGFDDVTLDLLDSDFDFSRDDDGDGDSNLEEVRQGTNPFSAN